MTKDLRGLGGLCYTLKPGDVLVCRLRVGHTGDHYNWPKKIAWPNTAAKPPAPTAR